MATASWILAASFAAAALLGPVGAHAQTQTLLCDQRASIIGHMAEKYREAPVAIGAKRRAHNSPLKKGLFVGSHSRGRNVAAKPS